MAGHLKTKSEYFQAVIERRKLFEVRNNDRDFRAGDKYILEEFLGTKYISACADCNGCGFFQYIYDECEAVQNCPLHRVACSAYTEEVYTGRRCLIRIKEVFNLENAGLSGYAAFTFDILNIIDPTAKGETNA